jgi:hypothetical protein
VQTQLPPESARTCHLLQGRQRWPTHRRVYINNFIITTTTLAEIKKFKEETKMQFRMSDLKLLTFYLRLEVQQSSGRIELCQAHYSMRILEVSSMAECNSMHMPMEEQPKLSRDSKAIVDMEPTPMKPALSCRIKASDENKPEEDLKVSHAPPPTALMVPPTSPVALCTSLQ